ncbi:MAG: hypothetical protein JXD23_01990 [Spirochaetales bacterium]|nr:hypothetical protein [Spirochaetales bacterium]
MITETARDQVIELGIRHKAGYLLEQAGYTLALAKLDGEPLYELLPDNYIQEFTAAIDQVRDSLKDRALAAEESKSSTQAVNEAVRAAKIWRRKVNNRADRAARMGKQIPAALITAEGVKGVPGVITQLDKMVKLLEANVSSLSGAGLRSLIDEGKDLSDGLKAVDASQEVKRLRELSEKVHEFHYQKGLVYIAIKVINGAGRELHVHDPAAATKYNLSILNRRVGGKKAAAAANA